MGKAILLLILIACVFYFLYDRGYMVVNSKSAVSYIGSSKGTGATFTSCNGYIKRIVRFKSDSTYTFSLLAELSKGDMSVELLDSAKQKVMQLNCTANRATVSVEGGKRYYLVVNFKSATGRYSLIKE